MTREDAVKQKSKVLEVRWFDLDTFDKDWIKDKKIEYHRDDDGVYRPVVYKDGIQVYP